MIFKYILDKISPSYNIAIDNKYCIYYRNRFERCKVCRDICLYDAISVVEDEIKIDSIRCKQCGLCKAKCPSAAITIDNFGELELLKKSKKKDHIYIGCKKSSEDVDFTFNCLNGLHIEYLTAFFILNREKKIYFKVTECQDCKISFNSGLEEQVKIAVKFLRRLNINVIVKFICEEQLDIHRDKYITRRELFQSIKTNSIDTLQDFVVNTLEEYCGGDGFNDRQLLLNVIDKLKDIEEIDNSNINLEKEIFTSFKVTSSCDGCGFCEGICPYEAWRITDREGEFSISHNVSKCRGCKLCINLCSNKSIEEEKLNILHINKGYIEKFKNKR